MDITPDTSVRSYPSTALSPNTVNTTPHQKYFDQNPPTHCYSTPNPKQPILCTSLMCPPTTVRGGEEPMYPTSPQPEPTFMCVCVCVCVQCCRSTIHGIQNRPPPPAPKETAKKCNMLCSPPPRPPGTTLDHLARKQELFRTCAASGCPKDRRRKQARSQCPRRLYNS